MAKPSIYAKKLILDLCKDNQAWNDHINSVVKHARMLAKHYNADVEICEIAAWLHDIVKIKVSFGIYQQKKSKKHHVLGSMEAANILRRINYPEEKIKKVQYCILTHSSDKAYKPNTLEAKIVSSADALSHFDNFVLMIKHNLKKNNGCVEKTRKAVLKKYKVTWNKLFVDKAREIALLRYEAIKVLLT